MDLGAVFRIVQGSIEVRGPVIKSREQEARLRRRHHPVRRNGAEAVFIDIKAQGVLGELHRADAAEHVSKYLVGGILLPHAIAAPIGHIVRVTGQQDQVVPLHRRALDDLLKQRADRAGVLQPGVPQGHEQMVLLPLRYLAGIKLNVQQILLGRSRQCLAQHRQNLLRLLLPGKGQRLVKFRDDLPVFIDVAPPHMGDVALIRLEAAPQLRDLFFCHAVPHFSRPAAPQLRAFLRPLSPGSTRSKAAGIL